MLFCISPALHGQPRSAPPAPDTLIFVNGEQLTGQLVRATGDGITFSSAMAGEITVKWANIKELRSDRNFAILTANQRLNRRNAEGVVPQGKITVEHKQITVATSSGPRSVPLANANRIVDAAAFNQAIDHPPGPFQGWAGAATGGVSLVRATQDSTTFTGAINLVRSTPQVDWLPPRDRSILGYNQAYGTTSQTGVPTAKTNIFHAAAEQDVYFSPRLFSFGSVTFDHNYSQSLNLQQAYGAGVGITLIKNAREQIDFKADAHYQKESFVDPTQNANLFGSTFSETWFRHLPRGLVFNEFGSISPSWNNTNDYSAHVNASLVFPVYRSIGFNIGAVDDYLNNAPVGFKRNSTQLTTGINYTIKPR